ncbi:MAG TPA: prepilin-type N-terminal cleavage/methylation domain-containing protein [Solirubrobacteraceae bacterium]|nr:prepilin-type N-terminal cleavage/methylation domain-containing protein [Solirubrobacteraceae bacterium]
MLQKLRQRAQGERGFTLIELLVVILIIGILAAIAIPSFLSQTSKAYDASAKELARTAETTADTYGTDNGNNFAGISGNVLNSYESTINTSSATAGSNAFLVSSGVSGNASGIYVVTTQAYSTGDRFSIVYNNGQITRFCGSSAFVPPTATNATTFLAVTTGPQSTSGGQSGCVNGSW